MMSTPLKSLLAGAALLAAPAALAGTGTSVPAFEAKIATARTASSPGGTAVTTAEMVGACNSFWTDDWMVDAGEHAYLGTKLADSTFLTGINGPAQKYLQDFHELNNAGPVAPLGLQLVTTPAAQLFGASGPLASSARIAEGYIPNGQGVTNNDTLLDRYYAVLAEPGAYEDQFWFQPITLRQLADILKGSANQQTPSLDEVDGALAYIHQISRNSSRLYVGYWRSYLHGGEAAGYVIAAVSSDRRFVRMVRVTSWSD
jgi:hypothetical protein